MEKLDNPERGTARTRFAAALLKRVTLFDRRVHSDYRRARSLRPLTACLDGECIASLISSLRRVLERR